ncbi:hypothetical protein [Flaviflagellibacter deserti]|jgi:hypothetical protein|uniref:Uncharacterized protein n=1 Tax=Flaviflagellibacter deserti TaxID=2267266 RepID=A0ABV9YYV9_9HYPH
MPEPIELIIVDDPDIDTLIEKCVTARQCADRLGLDVTCHLLDMALLELSFAAPPAPTTARRPN